LGHGSARLGTGDIPAAVAFLLSDAAAFINGQSLGIDAACLA